ncbi:MAG: dynamin family protein [Microcoleaceae cyanobacterium]
MAIKIEATKFIDNLDQVAQVRSEIAQCLNQMVVTLEEAESEGKNKSGQFGLERNIKDLNQVSQNLYQGCFRLLVLGDMKRGKSTFLNALIGENLLPSDVNPCTALLTILRYGKEPKVTVYFNNGQPPEIIDFKRFKHLYSIDPAEAKNLEREKIRAFPHVDHAVVEYPLALLEKGIEIVDSPGLNDTEARNELSLGYINNCHAILFVLRASQPCTLAERRYLENYIKDRGLSVFFLINAWDQVRDSLIDPDDFEELHEAEVRLRHVFRANLAEYCQIEDENYYEKRVFEISALNALRRRIKNSDLSLEGTGFPEFLGDLNTFLTQERATAEFRQAQILAHQTSQYIHDAVERRIPLLTHDLEELKQRINSVEPEFKNLNQIRSEFIAEIRTVRDSKVQSIINSFQNYVLSLENSFESDFQRYQPDIKFMDLFDSGKRKAFEASFKEAFEHYINDKISDWTISAEREMDTGFSHLSKLAAQYGADYAKVTNRMTEKLTGNQAVANNLNSNSKEEDAPAWAAWAMGLVSLASGNFAGAALAGAGFDWKNILLNLVTVVGISGVVTAISGIILGPVMLLLLSFGVGVLQADTARQKMIQEAQKEFAKHLPKIAQDYSPPISEAIQECFDTYEQEVVKRIDDDIQARQAELDNLIQQKEQQQINHEQELQRLTHFQSQVATQFNTIETICQNFVSSLA